MHGRWRFRIAIEATGNTLPQTARIKLQRLDGLQFGVKDIALDQFVR
jgi:hypothetical protein